MKIEDVQFDDEIRHQIPEFQTLLNFNTDEQNEFFRNWWENLGRSDFVLWYNNLMQWGGCYPTRGKE